MGNRQLRRRAQRREREVERVLREQGGRVIEPKAIKHTRSLAVWICVGCFDGNIQFPLVKKGVWRDQGIDFFLEDQPVKRFHKCSGTKHPESRGAWHREVMEIPDELWEKLTAAKGIESGMRVTDPRAEWRS